MSQGLRAITSSGDVALLLLVVVAPGLLWGQETVLLVFVSEKLLGTGSEGVGFLMAAIGLGGILAGAFVGRVAEHPRSGRVLTIRSCFPG